MSSKHLLCLACGVESVVEADPDKGVYTVNHVSVHGCPACGDVGVPADLDDAVDVHITKHELRILTIWATNYAQSLPEMSRAVRIITDRLGTQTDVALTLSQEIADLRASLPEATVEVYDSEGRPTDL
jgi:hypothetical protein